MNEMNTNRCEHARVIRRTTTLCDGSGTVWWECARCGRAFYMNVYRPTDAFPETTSIDHALMLTEIKIEEVKIRVKRLEELVAASRSETCSPDPRDYKREVAAYEWRMDQLRYAIKREPNHTFREGEQFAYGIMMGPSVPPARVDIHE